LKKKLIRPIKWPKARLEDLLIIPCLKRRIREEAIRNYLKGERRKPPRPFNIAPTNVAPRVILEGEDYGLKVCTSYSSLLSSRSLLEIFKKHCWNF
jgi:hypothetical protein